MNKLRLALVTTAATVALIGGLACGGAGTPDDNQIPAPATTTTTTTTGKPTAAATSKAPKLTREQQAAVDSANSYLVMQGFSRTGLIKQLVFEGYPKATATKAVDSLRVDWNEQAGRSAKSYLDMQGFSRKGLIEQLKFEGFTDAQAKAGAAKAGM